MPPTPGAPGDSAPDTAAALRLLADLQRAMHARDRAGIVEAVRGLVAVRAPLGDQWARVARLAADHAELALARDAIELFVASAGGTPAAQYEKISLLERIGALREAYDLFDALPADVPTPAANAFSRGTAALFLGETETARGHLERAVRDKPEAGAGWLSLAMSADLAEEPELADRIVAAERHLADADAPQQAAYWYARGKAHADRGEHALAFEAFARGARLMKAFVAYSRNEDRAAATEAVRGFDPGRVAGIAREQREPTARTIFVTGLPRSGTTLVEQILASHSAVSAGGELNLLPLVRQDVGGFDFASLERHVAAHGPGGLARLWDRWLGERFPEPGRVVDKSLDGGYFLGLAASLLPEAPLIWLTRDPLDCAWSCFRTHLFDGLAWSYDLADIAFHFVLHDQLLARWRAILGERLLVVPYEELATSPEPWIRRILAHCGLAEEPQPFAPHENRRAVTTSSVMQVRRPINTRAIGAAEPYRAFLGPFIEAYYR